MTTLFLDSGAFSLYNIHAKKLLASGIKDKHAFFKTKDFWSYVDQYAEFLKTYRKYVEFYVTVDAIHNPEISWDVLQYLEDHHGLDPVPVVHSGSQTKWLLKYLDAGYTLIGLGGGQGKSSTDYIRWADRIYSILCDTPDNLPLVRTHGFAMTNYRMMIRYPWWSVDSASWAKAAAFGSIFVPHKRQGKFTFAEKPYNVCFSEDSPSIKVRGKHFQHLAPYQKKIVLEWIESIDIPLGETVGGEIIEKGLINHYRTRAVANVKFFEALGKWLPKWPWSFRKIAMKGFFT